MRNLLTLFIVAPLLLGATPAFAQNPSADQIIKSLRPSPTGSLAAGNTRGIRLAAPQAEAATPQAAAPGPTPVQPPRVASARPVAMAW